MFISQTSTIGGFATLRLISKYALLNKATIRLMANISGDSPLASVNPAGLIISERLRAQVASLEQKLSNITDVTFKYGTADATLGQLRRTLTEIRTNAIAAANTGGLDDASQTALQDSADRLVDTFNATLDRATYNGAPLLDGSKTSVADISKLENVDLSSIEAVEASLAQIDTAAEEVDLARLDVGATVKFELESIKSTLEIAIINLIGARATQGGQFMDAFLSFSRFIRQVEIGAAVLAHANLTQKGVLGLFK